MLYEKILKIDPESGLAVNNLAALLLDRRSDAASLARALELSKRFEDSTEPALVDTLGWAYYRNGDYENAVRYLKIAVDAADQVPLLHYHLGMAYFAKQSLELARKELEQAVNLAKADYDGIEEARETLNRIIETTAAR